VARFSDGKLMPWSQQMSVLITDEQGAEVRGSPHQLMVLVVHALMMATKSNPVSVIL